jgi:2-polyprenyl-6-methoxyphenol hydroxylase-like FAD-dependent oxidoreductase
MVGKGAGAGNVPTVESPAQQVAQDPSESYTPETFSSQPRILSREEKKALLATRWESQLRETQKHAIIIGGGPGGLAAAITLAQMGMKVTVLEARADETGQKPAHARPHQISLRQDSLKALKTLNAYDDVMASSGFVEKELSIQGDESKQMLQVKVPEGQAQDHENSQILRPTLLYTDSVSQVRISDVEKSLLAQALEMGIEIKAGVKATVSKSENGSSYDVSIRKVSKDGDGYTPYGESESLGTADLVVAADGAGSPIRQSLGIEMLEQSAPKHYLGGHIQKGIGAETRKAKIQESDGMTRHMMATGHAKYDQTWVSVEITPEEAALPADKRAELLAEKAQWVMMQDVNPEDIGWGAGQVTTVQNRRAEVTTAGDNLVLFGDAAGTGSVWVGGGLNLALTTHLSALRSLASRILQGTDRAAGMEIYDKTVQWATTVWHRAGAKELGVKELPKVPKRPQITGNRGNAPPQLTATRSQGH